MEVVINGVYKLPLTGLLSLAAACLIAKCGGPAGPGPFSWEEVCALPESGVSAIEAGTDGLYARALFEYNVILKFENGRFVKDYVAPGDVVISDIGFLGELGAAAGRRVVAATFEPFLAVKENGTWTEVLITTPEVEAFSSVIPATAGRLWLTALVNGNSCLSLG